MAFGVNELIQICIQYGIPLAKDWNGGRYQKKKDDIAREYMEKDAEIVRITKKSPKINSNFKYYGIRTMVYNQVWYCITRRMDRY